MHHISVATMRGAVVCRGRLMGVVLDVVRDQLLVAPVVTKASDHFRGDVDVLLSDLGMPGSGERIVRCGQACLVHRVDQVVCAAISPALLKVLMRQRARVIETERTETLPPGIYRSNINPAAHGGVGRGRQVGRRGAA